MEGDLVRIDCPFCNRFLAHVRPDSDVFCPRCREYVYLGLDGKDTASLMAIRGKTT